MFESLILAGLIIFGLYKFLFEPIKDTKLGQNLQLIFWVVLISFVVYIWITSVNNDWSEPYDMDDYWESKTDNFN